MRFLFPAIAIAWALARAYSSGNYRSIRTYLWAMLAHTTLVEGTRLVFDIDTLPYFTIYAVTTAAILVCALAIGLEALSHLPRHLKDVVVLVSMTQGIMALFLFGIPQSGYEMLLVATAVVLSIAGIQCLVCGVVMPNTIKRHVHQTLGLLWVMQTILFYIYAAGMPLYPQGWEAIGRWLPATLVVLGMAKLGADFKHAHWHPAHRGA
jgi:hypothetical protein